MAATKDRRLIAASAVGIHLSIGSVYTWSVLTKPIVSSCHWGFKDVQLTFSIAILFLGLSAAFLGRLVERRGPRFSGTVASIFFGSGLLVSGLAIHVLSLPLLYLGYGVLAGIGLGVGYIAPVSTLVKWFPDRRGLATGLAIMGFGFAALVSSPIIQRLVVSLGLERTFYLLAAAYFAIMFVCSQYLAPPPPGWAPQGSGVQSSLAKQFSAQRRIELRANQAVKTRRFYGLWFMLFVNVTCGIAVISVASPLGQEAAGMTASQAATMVGLIGLFNGGGRIIWATLSDYIGRPNTYTVFFAIQILAFLILPNLSSQLLFQGVLFLIMTCYGGGFSCIPAFIGDLFGTRELAAIHGYTLTAWAAAGLVGPTFAGWVRETTGSYSAILNVSFALFLLALVVSLMVRVDMLRPESRQERLAAPVTPLPVDHKRTFVAKAEDLGTALDFVADAASRAGLPPEKVKQVRLAVEEATANICSYAYLQTAAINRVSYAYEEPGRYTIRLKDTPSQFEIELEDEGAAFNPLTVRTPDVDTGLEERNLTGLGIMLMRRMVDKVTYDRSGSKNVLALIMHKKTVSAR